jgi:hypothetical protein
LLLQQSAAAGELRGVKPGVFEVARWENALATEGHTVSLADVIEEVRGERYQLIVRLLRGNWNVWSKDYRNKIKRALPAISVSGTASDRRTLLKHSGVLQVDMDYVSERLVALKEKARKDPFVVFGFTSPSGNGLKLGLRVQRADSFAVQRPGQPEARHCEAAAPVERAAILEAKDSLAKLLPHGGLPCAPRRAGPRTLWLANHGFETDPFTSLGRTNPCPQWASMFSGNWETKTRRARRRKKSSMNNKYQHHAGSSTPVSRVRPSTGGEL